MLKNAGAACGAGAWRARRSCCHLCSSGVAWQWSAVSEPARKGAQVSASFWRQARAFRSHRRPMTHSPPPGSRRRSSGTARDASASAPRARTSARGTAPALGQRTLAQKSLRAVTSAKLWFRHACRGCGKSFSATCAFWRWTRGGRAARQRALCATGRGAGAHLAGRANDAHVVVIVLVVVHGSRRGRGLGRHHLNVAVISTGGRGVGARALGRRLALVVATVVEHDDVRGVRHRGGPRGRGGAREGGTTPREGHLSGASKRCSVLAGAPAARSFMCVTAPSSSSRGRRALGMAVRAGVRGRTPQQSAREVQRRRLQLDKRSSKGLAETNNASGGVAACSGRLNDVDKCLRNGRGSAR